MTEFNPPKIDELDLGHDLTPEVLARIEPIYDALEAMSSYPLSDGLERIEDPKSLDYPSVNDAYQAAYNRRDGQPWIFQSKFDFINNDSNLGWKLHLNATPDEVDRIYDFLYSQAFDFKYMSGLVGRGQTQEGKVFTVYTGSFQSTARYSREISEGLAGVLSYPVARGDVEFARGVVGRFYCKDYAAEDVDAYGAMGVQFPIADVTKLNLAGIEGSYPPDIERLLVLQGIRIATMGSEELDFGGEYFFS